MKKYSEDSGIERGKGLVSVVMDDRLNTTYARELMVADGRGVVFRQTVEDLIVSLCSIF